MLQDSVSPHSPKITLAKDLYLFLSSSFSPISSPNEMNFCPLSLPDSLFLCCSWVIFFSIMMIMISFIVCLFSLKNFHLFLFFLLSTDVIPLF